MDGITATGQLAIVGKPAMTVFSYGAADLDIFLVADELQARGWRMDRQRQPDTLHMIATPNHESAVEPFLADLAAALAAAAAGSGTERRQAMLYGVTADIPPDADPADYLRKTMGQVYDL